MISAERRHGRSSSPTGATKAIWPGAARRLRTAANSSSPLAPCTLSAPALSARMVSGSAAPSTDSSGAPAASGGSAAITTPAPSASSEREGLRSGLAARTAPQRLGRRGGRRGGQRFVKARGERGGEDVEIARPAGERAFALGAQMLECQSEQSERAAARRRGAAARAPRRQAGPMSPRRGPVWPPWLGRAAGASRRLPRSHASSHPPKLIAMRPGKPAATTRITEIRIPVRIFVQTLMNR